MALLRRAILFLGLLTVCSLPPLLHSQASADKRDAAVARLKTGQRIRFSAEGMTRLVGRAGVASRDTLDFTQDDMVRRIPIPAIDTLWTRGGSAKTGLLVGGAVGLLFGLVLPPLAEGLCEYDCGSSTGDYLIAAVGGAVIGGGLGALIGAAIPSWHRRYP